MVDYFWIVFFFVTGCVGEMLQRKVIFHHIPDLQ